METNTKDLLNQAITEALEKLNKTEDPAERKKIIDEIKDLTGVDISYEKIEQDRLNNNWKNELDEQKLVVEEKKLKNDKARLGVDVGKTLLYGILGVGSSIGGYFLGTWMQRDPKFERMGEKLLDFMNKR